MNFKIGDYQLSDVSKKISGFFLVLQLINIDENTRIKPIESQTDSMAFRVICEDNTRVNLDIYYGLQGTKMSDYFQLCVNIEGYSITIINSSEYGSPSQLEIDNSVEFMKSFLESEIELIGYFDAKRKLIYKIIQYKIDNEYIDHIASKNKPAFIFKKLYNQTLQKFEPWICR